MLLSTAGPVSHFQWDTISSPQTADVPFTATITAKDAEDNTVTGFTGPVSLSGQVGPRSVTIGAGTGKWDYPLHTSYHDARTQMIYEAGELGGGGPITSLALNVTTVPQVLYNWTIRIKHTALSAFTTNTWESTGWTTVYQSKQIISSTGWTTFVFSTPFDYDGVSNLMVDLSFRNSYSNGGSGSVQATLTSQNRSLTCSAGPEQGDPLAWSGTSSPAPSASTYLPNIRLNLGTPVAMTPTVSGSFVNGIWTGQVTVPQRATGMYLNAADGSSHVGTWSLRGAARPAPATPSMSHTSGTSA
ncbi:MAG: hypothetical protein NTV86_17050 [Planctomycetota bacterium]|nr:hypothetical protein [Planctomycetota bacterium]